jgi:hypothetical protein
MAARTAVVAGTATAVSGRVQRRHYNKWAEEDAQQDPQQYEQEAPPPAEEDDTNARLQNLAQLHTQGVLTDEEFAAAKRKLLDL